MSLKILTSILKGKTTINLSPFRNLKPVIVRILLRSLPEARSINLCGTMAIERREIGPTLAAINHDVDELYLLIPPSAPNYSERVLATIKAMKRWNRRCNKVLVSPVMVDLLRIRMRAWLNWS